MSARFVILVIVETGFDIFDSRQNKPLPFCWNFNYLRTGLHLGGLA
jgi:hypothetical protein